MRLLSSIWSGIQRSLFPFLEEELGPMTEKQRKLVSILELIRIEDSISYTYKTGRPHADRYPTRTVDNFSRIRFHHRHEDMRYLVLSVMGTFGFFT